MTEKKNYAVVSKDGQGRYTITLNAPLGADFTEYAKLPRPMTGREFNDFIQGPEGREWARGVFKRVCPECEITGAYNGEHSGIYAWQNL